jgi:hypothetical protein
MHLLVDAIIPMHVLKISTSVNALERYVEYETDPVLLHSLPNMSAKYVSHPNNIVKDLYLESFWKNCFERL